MTNRLMAMIIENLNKIIIYQELSQSIISLLEKDNRIFLLNDLNLIIHSKLLGMFICTKKIYKILKEKMAIISGLDGS